VDLAWRGTVASSADNERRGRTARRSTSSLRDILSAVDRNQHDRFGWKRDGRHGGDGKRLREAGFDETDIQTAGPRGSKKNLIVATMAPAHARPVLFIGHLDVVEARREDWTTDPFCFC